MEDPPLFGALQETPAAALALVAATEVGASGVVDGVTGALGAESGPWPLALVAATVKV